MQCDQRWQSGREPLEQTNKSNPKAASGWAVQKTLRIQSRVHELAGRSAVMAAVTDSGISLSAETRKHLFEALHTSKPQGMGRSRPCVTCARHRG